MGVSKRGLATKGKGKYLKCTDGEDWKLWGINKIVGFYRESKEVYVAGKQSWKCSWLLQGHETEKEPYLDLKKREKERSRDTLIWVPTFCLMLCTQNPMWYSYQSMRRGTALTSQKRKLSSLRHRAGMQTQVCDPEVCMLSSATLQHHTSWKHEGWIQRWYNERRGSEEKEAGNRIQGRRPLGRQARDREHVQGQPLLSLCLVCDCVLFLFLIFQVTKSPARPNTEQ